MFYQAGCWEIEPSRSDAVSRWLISFGERLGSDRWNDHAVPSMMVYQVKHFPGAFLTLRDLYLSLSKAPIYTVLLYSIELQYLCRILFVISFSREQTLLVRQTLSSPIVEFMKAFSCES